MRITREQLYAMFDITEHSVVFVDIDEKDEDSIKFYKDGNKDSEIEIRFDGLMIE